MAATHIGDMPTKRLAVSHVHRCDLRFRARRQRGASVVEFAIVLPLLLMFLLGVIDFGSTLSNQISVRQGAREAARQGAVANFGPTESCGATFQTSGSENMRKLICLTKARSDIRSTDVKVAIRFDPGPGGYPAPGGAVSPVGNGIIVCSATPMVSLSKMFSPLLSGNYIQTKVVMRVESASGVAEAEANETDPTGQNWNWCTP